MSEEVHGNDKRSEKPQHLYEISDNFLNRIFKFGISGSKLNRDGGSRRANTQVNALNRDSGWKRFWAKVLRKDIEGRATALEIEKEHVKKYKEENNDTPPEGNKRPKV